MFSNIAAYSKALVPIVVMIAAFVQTKWGIPLNIGDSEALVVVGIFTAMLTYLIPNKPPEVTKVEVPSVTKIDVDTVKEVTEESPEVNLVKTRKKVS